MKQIVNLPISSIVADDNQPRKYFNAEKIKTLKNSIKSYGVMSPIIVQEMSKGKYLLVDGERRWRSSVELGLKDIPALIEAPQKETERLVRQFNIQEQHESWTPVEKAVAIVNLAKTMGLSLAAVCKLLNVTEQEQRKYVAFAELIDKDAWVRNEIPLDYAQTMRALKSQARTITHEILEKDYTVTDEKKLEAKIIKLIKKGVINKRNEITKLRDAFKKDPKSIEKFVSDADSTPMSLFASTKARGAYHLRNIVASSKWINGHVSAYLEAKDVKPDSHELTIMKKAVKDLNIVIALG